MMRGLLIGLHLFANIAGQLTDKVPSHTISCFINIATTIPSQMEVAPQHTQNLLKWDLLDSTSKESYCGLMDSRLQTL